MKTTPEKCFFLPTIQQMRSRLFPFIFGAAVLLMTVIYAPSPAHAQTTYNVPDGGNLQAYLNIANPGDTLILNAGSTYVGPFTLPYKQGTGTSRDWITIVTSAGSSLPWRGNRVGPANAGAMPKLVAPGGGQPVINTAVSAHHYRFVGIEFTLRDANAFAYELITLGSVESNQNSYSQVPHHFEIDRCYIHGLPSAELKRGVTLNSSFTDIINSYISEFHVRGQEAQAVMGWNGPGPFSILNNYLEAAGENVMFGGADPSIPNIVPSDIEIRNNYFFKPLAWRGAGYAVKNLLELKNAQRVRINSNVLENCWADGQDGTAVLFTVRNQDGTAPWSVVQDIEFTNNIVRHSGAGINILGIDNNKGVPSKQTNNILIRNNLFEDINSAAWGGLGKFLTITQTANVTVDHNTVFQTGNITWAYGVASTGFVFTNNIVAHNDYGIAGDSHASGTSTLNYYFPGSVVTGNALVGAGPPPNGPFWEPELWYPTGNYYPLSFDAVGFANRAAGDYRLTSTSPYKNKGTDGKDVGADIDALNLALSRNPIDDQRFFVWQQYLDFLNRAPEPGGLDFWTGQITKCGSDSACVISQRRVVSLELFKSDEYVANNPAFANPNTPTYNEAFVTQCYRRYLQREPDTGGHDFWVTILNSQIPNSNYIGMIGAFIDDPNSRAEYRSRFGQP